jgi:hypothetical protein
VSNYSAIFPYAPMPDLGPDSDIPENTKQHLAKIAVRARSAIPTPGQPPGSDLLSRLRSLQPAGPAPAEPGLADYGKAFMSGVGQVGAMGVGALEYGSRQLLGSDNAVTEGLTSARQSTEQFADNWYTSMSPESQERAARQFLSLDPQNSVWRGGITETMATLGLALAQNAPSTLVTILPGAIWLKAAAGIKGAQGAAMAANAIKYLGASEGILSVGQIASNVAHEVEQAKPEELQAGSQRYRDLIAQGADDTTARQTLITEAQGYAPLVGGLITGAIGAMAGRYLKPVFESASGRMALAVAGGGIEAGQEALQSGNEQAAQNFAAKVYDNSRPLFQGVAEQSTAGAVVGGLLGGVTTGLVGPGQRVPIAPNATPGAGEETPPPPSGPASFDDVFKQQEPPPGGYTGQPAGYDSTGEFGSNFDPLRDPTEDSAVALLAHRREGSMYPIAPDIGLRAPRQRALDLGPVPLDIQQAIVAGGEVAGNIRRDGMMGDLFDQPSSTAQEEVAGYNTLQEQLRQPGPRRGLAQNFAPGQGLYPVQQESMLPQFDEDQERFARSLPSTYVRNTQQELPLTQGADIRQGGRYRQRGLGRTDIVRGRGPDYVAPIPEPQAPDLSQPEGFRGNESGAPGTYLGTAADENQLDMFNPAPAAPLGPGTAPLPSQSAPPTAPGVLKQGFQLSVFGGNGDVLQQQVFATSEEANQAAAALYDSGQLSEGLYARVDPVTSQSASLTQRPGEMDDEPSAEPFLYLDAQMRDLANPDNMREGVYLSAANIQHLRETGRFDELRGVGVPLANFDDKGGTLIAKNRQVADEVIGMKAGGHSMQEILGAVTGSGTGKPAGANIAVEQRDKNGAVTRSALVATNLDALRRASAWDREFPDRTTHVMTAEQSIQRRNELIAQEKQAGNIPALQRRTRTTIEQTLRDRANARDLALSATRDVKTPDEVLQRLGRVATDTRTLEKVGEVGGFLPPGSYTFSKVAQADRYSKLFELLKTAIENKDEKAARMISRQLGVHLASTKPTTAAERIMAVGHKVNPKGFRGISPAPQSHEEEDNAFTIGHGDLANPYAHAELVEAAKTREIPPEDSVEFEHMFLNAVDVMAAAEKSKEKEEVERPTDVKLTARVNASAVASDRPMQERIAAGATGIESPAGRSARELMAAHTRPSEKKELIGRAFDRVTNREMGSGVSSQGITGRATEHAAVVQKEGQPTETLVSRRQRKDREGNARTMKSAVLGVRQLFDLNVPRKVREGGDAKRAEHAARVKRTYEEVDQSVKLLTESGEASVRFIRDEMKAADSAAKRTRVALADAYLKVLLAYGKILSQMHGASFNVLKEADKYNASVKYITDRKTPDGIVYALSKLMRAESLAQAQAAARMEPVVLQFAHTAKGRLVQNAINLKRLAGRFELGGVLHEAMKGNPMYEAAIAPVITKISGFIARQGGSDKLERRWIEPLTLQDLQMLRAALSPAAVNSERGANYKTKVVEPFVKLFKAFGFRFDENGMLIVPTTPTGQLDDARLNEMFLAERNVVSARRPATEIELAREARLVTDKKTQVVREAAINAQLAKRIKKAPDAPLNPYAFVKSLTEAAQALADNLETNNKISAGDVVRLFSTYVKSGLQRQLLDQLGKLNLDDVHLSWDDRIGRGGRTGQFAVDANGNRTIKLNRALLNAAREKGIDPMAAFIHAVTHETVHAATVGQLEANGALRAQLRSLVDMVRTAATKQGMDYSKHYGLTAKTNVEAEFVAEAFSNPEFQDFLRGVQIDMQESGWSKFVKFVRRALHLDGYQADNALDAIMQLSESLLTGERSEATNGMKWALENVPDNAIREHVGAAMDRLLRSNRVTNDIYKRARDKKLNLGDVGDRMLLSAMSQEQIADQYHRAFYDTDEGSSGLSDYHVAASERDANISAVKQGTEARPGGKAINREWTQLAEKYDDQAIEFARIEAESSLERVFPDRDLDAPGNEHVKSDEMKKVHAELRARLQAIDPEWTRLYGRLRDMYGRTIQQLASLRALNALRPALTGGDTVVMTKKQFNAKYDEGSVQRLGLDTVSGIQKEFGKQQTFGTREEAEQWAANEQADNPSMQFTEISKDKKTGQFEATVSVLSDDMASTVAAIARIPKMQQGPYAPLFREGDYVVHANLILDHKTFQDKKEARTWANTEAAKEVTRSARVERNPDGSWTGSVVQFEVQYRKTRAEAEAVRQVLVQEYGETGTSDVELKNEFLNGPTLLKSDDRLSRVMDKLTGNPAAQNAIKELYMEQLADASFRQHQRRRENILGAEADNAQQAMARYTEGAAYHIAQLRYGHVMSDALYRMDQFIKKVAEHKIKSPLDSVKLGHIYRELKARDTLAATPSKVIPLIQKGTQLSQLFMLLSPAYWFRNSMQVPMVMLPWLAARHGTAKAVGALLRAQKLIAHPLLTQTGRSWLGAKAAISASTGEDAFEVLEQIEGWIRQRSPPAQAAEYMKLLDKLKQQGALEITTATELRNMSEGKGNSQAQRLLDATRIMSHLTEVNNRVVSAIAAYDLAREPGPRQMTQEAAAAYARSAVSKTHMNYSASNAPRLFGRGGPLGRASPLVFQFMKYPQGMYALLIDNFYRARRGASQQERREGAKTIAGLLMSHAVVGGMTGVMLQPIKWALGAAAVLLGGGADQKEPYTWTNAMSGDIYDKWVHDAANAALGTDLGQVLARGLPTALGQDYATSLSLGSLYMLDLKADTTESLLGSLVKGLGGPTLNLGMRFHSGMKYMMEGQPWRGTEMLLPKMFSDVSKALRYSQTGIVDTRGAMIESPENLHPIDLFWQSLGVQPARIEQLYEKRGAINTQKAYEADQRAALLRRWALADMEDRQEVRAKIDAFNSKRPIHRITASALIRARQAMRKTEASNLRYTANLRPSERQLAEDFEGYNDE